MEEAVSMASRVRTTQLIGLVWGVDGGVTMTGVLVYLRGLMGGASLMFVVEISRVLA